MKKRTHKYFVNQRFKNKLEANSQGFKTYWSHVVYYTDVPDTRDIRECTNSILWVADRRQISIDEAIQDHVDWYGKHTKGRHRYYERPEVPYTIHKVHTSPKYSKRRKDLCREANRRVRHRAKQYGEIYQHNLYKKVYDVAWELD
jgi:hypothetical protein